MMMGFGTSGNGGSSPPPSNLSALAPPFSVDRSNSKPSSLSPLVNFSEPPYALPFHSSFPNWQYSHRPSASGPDFYPSQRSEVDSIRTTCLPSSDLPSPNFNAASNPNFGAASDSFSFRQYSSEVPGKHVGDKSYYPPYVSPMIADDVPLVALNEPRYDLLPSSRAPLDGPSQVDCSDLEYMPQWDSSWSGLSDQGKRAGLDGSFCTEDKNIAGSYVYKNYVKQEDASVVSSGKYVDAFVLDSQIVAPSKNKVQNSGFISRDSSRTSISGSSILPESHGQGPFPKPASSFWNHQISYNASYDQFFQPLESCQNEFLSVKKSAPLVIRPPPSIGTSSTAAGGVSTKDDKIISNVIAITKKSSGFYDSSDQKELLLHGKRANDFFVASSSIGKVETEYKPSTKDVLDYVSKGEMEFQPADINASNGFTLESDNPKKAFTSVEDSSEGLDHCNPSVDSPCWKGAPASCFSLPEFPDTCRGSNVQHTLSFLPEVSETCPGSNLQQTQNSPPTYDTVKLYEENGYVELGSLLCPEKLSNTGCPVREHSAVDEVKAGFDIPTLTSNKGVQFSNNVGKPKKECGFHNDSISFPDSKSGLIKERGLEKREVTSETDFKPYSGLNTNDASENGSVPLHGLESTSCLPCSGENEKKLGKVDATESIPKVNVRMMVNTVHNLSELLLFHFFDDVSAVSEKDRAAIKQAINNLEACMSMKIPPMKPTQESRFSQQSTFHEPNLHKGVTKARSLVRKEPGARLDSWVNDHCTYEGTAKNNSSGKKVEECADLFSLRGDGDTVRDDERVQAIKGVLKEDFIGENEIPSETLLYKNLWLEAEAALCSISYRARFNRMKIEMEKHKSDNMKDVDSPEVAKKEPSSEVSPDWNITQKETPKAKDNPMLDISVRDPSLSTITKSVDDVEASVMARLDILKRRGQSSNSKDAGGQQLMEVVDLGFAVKSNHFPFVGDRSEAGSLNLSDELHLRNSCGNSKIDEFGPYISSSYMHSPDAQVIGSGRKKKMGSQILCGWNDGSTSDWEHVLKDEFSGQN